MQLFPDQSLMEEFDNFISTDPSQKNLGKESSTPVHASSSKLLEVKVKQEEHEVNEIAFEDDKVDHACLPKIGLLNGNPYFVSKARIFNHLYVPRIFAKEHASKLGEVRKLRDPSGRITDVSVAPWKVGETYLTGWLTIYEHNSIRKGDLFVCEVVQGNGTNETYIQLHLNLHKISKLIKHSPPLKGSPCSQDLKITSARSHASSNVSHGDGIDAREHVIKKHKGNSFDLPTPHGSSEMSKEEKTIEQEVGISSISPAFVAVSSEVDLVNINGYKVKATTAPILESIFAKYGDITVNCSCKSLSMKTSLLEVLCNTIQRLRCSDTEAVLSNLKVIESEIFDVENNNIDVTWLHEHLEKLRKVAACCEESLQLKDEVQQSGIQLSSLTEEVEQWHDKLTMVYKRFGEAKKREGDMKCVISNIEVNILRLDAEKALLIQGLSNELP